MNCWTSSALLKTMHTHCTHYNFVHIAVCLACIRIVSSPDLLRRIYHFQYNAWIKSTLGLVWGLGPRLASMLFVHPHFLALECESADCHYDCMHPMRLCVPRPHPRGGGLVTSSCFLGLHQKFIACCMHC